ncbi:MAG: helix-turn-helix domain-containing protein [Bacteroidota bacterium]
MNLANLFLLVSSFQGFLLAALLIFSPFFKSKANNYLGYAIGILSIIMLNIFLDNIRLFNTYPKLGMVVDVEWAFLFPVLFFEYLIRVTNHRLSNSKKLKWLYLPFLLSVIFILCIHLEYNFSLYEIKFEGKDFLYDFLYGLQELLGYAFNIVFLIWSYRVIKKSPDSNSLITKWVKKLWFFVFVITCTWIALFLIDVFLIDRFPVLDHYILFDLYILAIELCLLVYWIAYTGLYKLKLANERKEILDLLHKTTEISENAARITLVKEESSNSSNNFLENNTYFIQLERLMQEQFIYRDPDLSREVVAEKLGISTGYLSQIVNKVTQKNFAAYINSFRVEETKRMMMDEQFDKYSLLSIGLESGFKSKTTFYNSFKKETGCTPNQFKNLHK